ncbi:hypothetical protein GS462_11235 [Rhodococcus hoagii]|nr:hypothetical protein [Prescottella equi]MBM4650985.1 hypothetical protein [Prescottella equi]MBM4686668.1 hypothetical protein [Prescottella equi]
MPPAELTFASAIGVTATLLNQHLADGVRAGGKWPKSKPASFVRVSRPGGTRDTQVTDRPFLLFECWAPNSVEAEALGNRVRAIMPANQFEFVDGHKLTGWTEVSFVEFDDPAVTTHSRWQVTGTLGIAARR